MNFISIGDGEPAKRESHSALEKALFSFGKRWDDGRGYFKLIRDLYVRFAAFGAVLVFSFFPLTVAAQTLSVGGSTTLRMQSTPQSTISFVAELMPVKKMKVMLTAYTSSVEETDDTPFVTASGKSTGDGIAAANFLPFGTKFMIPAVFGDKVFVIEDRMHPRMVGFVDVWVPTKAQAFKIGKRQAEIVILAEAK